jgi:hypothetical protein
MRGFGDRAAKCEIKAKAARPVSDEGVAKGQIELRPKVRAQIDDGL